MHPHILIMETLKLTNPQAALYMKELRDSLAYYKQQHQYLEEHLNRVSVAYEYERNVSDQLAKELAVLKPKKMTEAEYIAINVKRLQEARAKRLEIKQLFKDQGVCPECEGEKELGGQFSGGTWQCPACNGTGTYDTVENIR